MSFVHIMQHIFTVRTALTEKKSNNKKKVLHVTTVEFHDFVF